MARRLDNCVKKEVRLSNIQMIVCKRAMLWIDKSVALRCSIVLWLKNTLQLDYGIIKNYSM